MRAPALDKKAFGRRVRERRVAQGLIQRELAGLVETDENKTVSSWENGHSVPRGRTLILLAQALGCSVEWLLHGDVDDGTSDQTDVRVIKAVREYAEHDPTAPILTSDELEKLRRVHLGEIEPTPEIVRSLALGLVNQRR